MRFESLETHSSAPAHQRLNDNSRKIEWSSQHVAARVAAERSARAVPRSGLRALRLLCRREQRRLASDTHTQGRVGPGATGRRSCGMV